MAVNKIKISANTRKVLNKTKEILGIQGENMKDVLFFALSEKIDGTAVVEIELPNGVQSFVELIKVEDGYELPVKSVLTEQAGFVKFQLRILQNKVEVFKSEIFELEVKESLNAIYEAPEEYPTWLDKLEDLQTELNNSEKERISNENERIESEEARKENFTQMQESVKGAISNIKDLTENYNLNATEKTNKFDENYTEKKKAFDDNYSETLKSFNDNAETKYDNYNKNAENKTSEYNKNNDEKLKAYNDNHTTKITNFDTNTKNKTDEYNSNASKKLDDYNSNDTTKTEKYNENATTKLSDYNSNATAKKKEYDTNAENKIVEFNNNATEKLDEYNQNAESLTNRVIECESENERLRNDIKSIALPCEASGENIHLEDSSNARCEIEIGGNHQQETRSGKNRINLGLLGSGTLNGVTYTYNESNQSITFNGTCTKDNTRFIINDNANIQTIAKKTTLTAQYLAGSVSNYFTARIADNEWKHNLLLSLLALNSSNNKVSLTETEDMVGVHVDIKANNGTIFNNFTIQLMLTDEVDTEYEMYGASPSIDYPSPVKSVGNIKNILDMSNAKGGTSGGITCAVNEDGSYSYVGTASSKTINIWLLGSYSNKTSIFRLEPGTYYIDGVMLYDANNPLANPGTTKIFSFINAHDITGVRAPDAVPGNTYDETKYPIVAKIDHEIPWVPYNYGSAKIDIFNKNYLSKIPKTSVTAQGITSTFDGEKFICKGTAQTNYFNLFTEKVYKKISKGIKTFSTNKLKKGRAFIHFDYVDGTGQNYYTSINTNQVRFTLNKDVKSYRLNVDSITAGDTIDDNIYVQLEDGNIATEIEKAENQEYLVDVQQEMLDGDTFVRQDGKWYEKHNWITLLNENIINNIDGIKDESKKTITTSISLTETPAEKSAISNILTYANNWNDTEHMIFSASLNTIYCLYNKDRFSELNYETIKKEIGEFGGIIKYKSNKSTYLECTETQSKVLDEIYNKAHTYKNITNISAESAEINPIVNVKYLKDTETEHNKLQAQINEIKQLLSTTETSALLVNNLEKDLRMEVE
jgi:hypothetical protein